MKKCEIQGERQTESVGHKEAFTASVVVALVESQLLLCEGRRSRSGTRRGKGESPRFHMCANVVSGTLPGDLLI